VHEHDGRAFARHAVRDLVAVQLDVAHGERAGALSYFKSSYFTKCVA
jgi:hypothetical protein